MRLRLSLPPSITLTLLTAVSYAPEAAAAAEAAPPPCGQGVRGIAEAGSVVCAQSESGDLYCDHANDAGEFDVVRGVVSPSTVNECLPTTGVLTLFQEDCFSFGMAVDRDDQAVAYGGPWLDIRCNRCGPGRCIGDSFVDSCVAYAPDSYISLAFCGCELMDPSCGMGTCVGASYCEGPYCSAPVCYAPDSPISQAMCGGVTLDPNHCLGCTPETLTFTSGVNDNFNPRNNRETPAPGVGLSTWIAANYPHPGIRPYDTGGSDQYFAHTFTGLRPPPGGEICGARLTTRIQNNHYNDSLALLFFDSSGTMIGPSWGDSLVNLGIAVGSSQLITIDIGSLPGVGAAMLAQMASGGWLDMFVQDDSMVDFVELQIDICCPCVPSTTVKMAGVDDNFSTANGVESMSPSAGLLYWLNVLSGYSIPNPRNFDENHSDQYVIHTFTGLAPTNGAHICGARLRTRIQNNHWNDSIGFHFFDGSGTQVAPGWADRLNNVGFPDNAVAMNIIDIGSLPGGAAMLTQMQNGWLDIMIQDDAMVDFLELTVNYCCEDGGCYPYDSLQNAGVQDNYTAFNGQESPVPSASLLNYMSVNWNTPPPRDFDTFHYDHYFGHTFANLAPQDGTYICDATLTTAVSNQHGNDAMWLFFTNPQAGHNGLYWNYLSNLGVPAGTSGTISINIASLQNGAFYLQQMEQFGYLDWVIQDDTAVDYGSLQVSYCCRGEGEIEYWNNPNPYYPQPTPVPPTSEPGLPGTPVNPSGRAASTPGAAEAAATP